MMWHKDLSVHVGPLEAFHPNKSVMLTLTESSSARLNGIYQSTPKKLQQENSYVVGF